LNEERQNYLDRGSYIDELEKKIESVSPVAAVPDVQHLVTEGPELEDRMAAARILRQQERQDLADKIKLKANRQVS
jgi:hypothetical protein